MQLEDTRADGPRLIADLWRAREDGGVVTAAASLEFEQGRAILADLVAMALERGEEIVGWKVAHLPEPGGETFACAAPVLSRSFDAYEPARLVRPRVEAELVARVEDVDARGRPIAASWHVGLEVIHNHDPAGFVSPGWAMADWGFNAAAAIGDACEPPGPRVRLVVAVTQDDAPAARHEGRVLDPSLAFAALARDCAAVARPCRAGDLVWTGALAPPQAIATAGGSLSVTVEGLGRAALGGRMVHGGGSAESHVG